MKENCRSSPHKVTSILYKDTLANSLIPAYPQKHLFCGGIKIVMPFVNVLSAIKDTIPSQNAECLLIAELRKYRYQDQLNIMMVPLLAVVLCNDLGTDVNENRLNELPFF